MIELRKQNILLNGEIKIQGDEDISIYSIILSSLAIGKSTIEGVLESKNILNLIEIIKQFGVNIYKDKQNWIVEGIGFNEFREPVNFINIKNCSKILNLLIGLFSSYNFKLYFKGDDTLSNINLKNIFKIFNSLNVNFDARNDENLPFLMKGNKNKKDLNYEINEYNYVLKNLLLLSSLNSNGLNKIIEKEKTRNHLEILMKFFGINFEEHDIGDSGNLTNKIGKEILIKGNQKFYAKNIIIPSNTSFSSFISALAILIPNSNIKLKNVLLNQHRDAFYRTLTDMGANISFINQRIICGEKVADINVKYGKLNDTIIPANRIYKMMFEYPILILIASLTEANIEIQGIKNIKLNDSNNFNYIINILKKLNVNFQEDNDSLKIKSSTIDFDKLITINESEASFNVIFSMALFGLFSNKGIQISDKIEDYYPNLKEFLKNLRIIANSD